MQAQIFFRILRYAVAVACVTAVFGLKAAELEAREPNAAAEAPAADIGSL